MIKIVGIKSLDFEKSSISEVNEYFKDKEEVQLDLETFGFDCHTKDVMCVQLGDLTNQFVIHPRYLYLLKDLLEEKLLIGHNIKFDLKFLYKNDVFPKKVYDTFLAETVLYCGDKLHKKGLAAVAKTRLGVDLDKSVRDNIWKEGLTKRVIEYSADDVKYLQAIKDSQNLDLTKKDLHKALDIENKFVLFLAYVEYCGFKLDKEKWQAKMLKDYENLKKAEEVLNQYIKDTPELSSYISLQGDLFSEERKIDINWSSSKQVIELFEKLQIPVEIVEKGVKKKSVEAKHIGKYRKQFPIVEKYLEYKAFEKITTTYGNTFIKHINPITGRIHTNFRQVMDTGRLSSGGKNKETKEEYINFQNIPSDEETRSCFIAEEGNVLCVGDYSGQEQIVLANKCLDKNLLKFYDDGLDDMHSFVASKMFPELANTPFKIIKNEHPEKRQESKIAGFIVTYGGAANNIADQLNKSIEDGERVFNAYFQAFPDMKTYFDKAKQEGLKNGYILINNISNRKSYIGRHAEYVRLSSEINRQFWEKYRIEKEKYNNELPSNFEALKFKVSEYFKIKGEIERKSLNFPIQGSAAEITKTSGILFFEWIRENNLFNTVKVVNQVHDENVVECPEYMAEEVKNALTDCMLKAGQIYCNRVPLKVAPKITKVWQK